MERAVAIRKLGRLLGKNVGYRVDPKAPTPDEREEAQRALPHAVQTRNDLNDRLEARRNAILQADDEYQALKLALAEAKKRADLLWSISRHRKITVGTSNGLFFSVKAEGDSWEDVIGQLTAKKVS